MKRTTVFSLLLAFPLLGAAPVDGPPIRVDAERTVTIAPFLPAHAAATFDAEAYRKITEPFVYSADPAKWTQLKKGMTREEVAALLGEPFQRDVSPEPRFVPPNTVFMNESWDYGGVFYPGLEHRSTARFSVAFSQGKLASIDAPSCAMAPDGAPDAPEIMYPKSSNDMRYLPHIVDLRWALPAGRHPMRFEVEVDLLIVDPKIRPLAPHEIYPLSREIVGVPHFAVNVGGCRHARWRVRAINDLGESNWSEYGYFGFKAPWEP